MPWTVRPICPLVDSPHESRQQDSLPQQGEASAAEHLTLEHLKSYVESAGVIMSPLCNHGLGRWLERHDAADGEVAGARPARAGRDLADGMDGSRTCTPHDRRLRPRTGRVPADVRARGRRPGHREPRAYRRLRAGVDFATAPAGR